MDFLQDIAFYIGDQQYTYGRLIFIITLLVISFLIWLAVRKVLPIILKKSNVSKRDVRKIWRLTHYLIAGLVVLALVRAFRFDFNMAVWSDRIFFPITLFIDVFIIIQIARILDWSIEHLVGLNYKNRDKWKPAYVMERSDDDTATTGNKTIQWIAWTLAIIFSIQRLDVDAILYAGDSATIRLTSIFIVLLIVLIVRLIAWFLIHVVLFKVYKGRGLALGSQYAVNQLLKYVLYVFGLLYALDTIGINMNIILGGAAALLVGIGLGLQQIFNDLFSGLVLLFDRSIEVGDVIEVDGEVGIVSKIGLRTTNVETRDAVTLILPNHRIVSGKVTNWNHDDKRVRFVVKVGVAYGSDTSLVKQLLLDCTKDHHSILSFPQSFVRFSDFGDSSLDFELHFWSTKLMQAEDLKSDVRFRIDKAFREHNIEIPFPQRVIWTKE